MAACRCVEGGTAKVRDVAEASLGMSEIRGAGLSLGGL